MKRIIFFLLFLLMCAAACRTCPPPKVVKVPVEVQVPVPIPPSPLAVPQPPEYEVCNGLTSAEVLSCAARNVVKLRDYNARLLAEIEAHNAAVTP